MNKSMHHNEFDKLLRDKLSNVEMTPSNHLWDRIAPVIPKYSPWGQILTPFSKIFLGTVFVGTILITTVSIRNSEQNQNDAINMTEAEQVSEQVLIDNNNFENNTVTLLETSIVQNNNTESNNPVQFTQSKKGVSKTETGVVESEQLQESTNTSSDAESLFAEEQQEEQQEIIITNTDNNPTLTMMPLKSGLLGYYGNPVLSKLSQTQFNNTPPDYVNTSEISLNVGLQSELFYFDPALYTPRKTTDFSLNLTLRYTANDLFFETGITGTFLTQTNLYKNVTLTETLVSQYEQVDSVQFLDVWDPIQGAYVTQPVFFTSLVSIYETTTTEELETKDDAYMYLQIPVYIGIRKSVKRISLEAKTGFSYSSLIYTSAQNKSYYNENISLISAEQSLLSQKRNAQYWSFLFSIGGSYKINSNLEFYITPTYRYLLNPMFSGNQPSRRTPYAFGLHSGFRIIF